MAGMSISEVARRAGLRPSALRYYEQIGILSPPPRAGGKRRYDASALRRLAVVQKARQLGFSLAEIRQLFGGFSRETPASERWRRLADRKLAELDLLSERVRTMQQLLRKMQACRCATLDDCGRAMVERVCR